MQEKLISESEERDAGIYNRLSNRFVQHCQVDSSGERCGNSKTMVYSAMRHKNMHMRITGKEDHAHHGGTR